MLCTLTTHIPTHPYTWQTQKSTRLQRAIRKGKHRKWCSASTLPESNRKSLHCSRSGDTQARLASWVRGRYTSGPGAAHVIAKMHLSGGSPVSFMGAWTEHLHREPSVMILPFQMAYKNGDEPDAFDTFWLWCTTSFFSCDIVCRGQSWRACTGVRWVDKIIWGIFYLPLVITYALLAICCHVLVIASARVLCSNGNCRCG